MSATEFDPESILAALEREGVRYVVIGGLAAVLQGSPVFTEDVDICPDRDRENLARLARALRNVAARIRTEDAPDGLPFACDPAARGKVVDSEKPARRIRLFGPEDREGLTP